MPSEAEAIVDAIDGILAEVKRRDSARESVYLSLRQIRGAIERYTEPGSAYRRDSDAMTTMLSRSGSYASALDHVTAILSAIRSDYAAGRMRSVLEVVHASLFADFLEQAEHLRATGYVVPAAVVAGSTLEAHLRQLGAKHAVSPTTPSGDPKKASALNSELRAAGAYALNDDKQITAWLGVRNDAAHGKPVADGVVQLMIAGVRDFISRVPA